MDRILKEMEEYATLNNVPIMLKDGINYLTDYIKENNIKNILEIGTAIGYSASKMALVSKDIKVTTIERDKDRYLLAINYINKLGLNNQSNVILDDAVNVELSDTYDLIFIDAAKSQYIKFFEKFTKNLKINGVVISDNLNFHGLTHTKEPIESRNVRGLVRKLNLYIDYLKGNDNFETTFMDIGDGLAISIKKKDTN